MDTNKTNGDSGSTPATTSNVRCWSRNLSARRHKELERMNEMEKRRQYLEIRKQNDFFKQMSSNITEGKIDHTSSTSDQKQSKSSEITTTSNGVDTNFDSGSSGGQTLNNLNSTNRLADKKSSDQQPVTVIEAAGMASSQQVNQPTLIGHLLDRTKSSKQMTDDITLADNELTSSNVRDQRRSMQNSSRLEQDDDLVQLSAGGVDPMTTMSLKADQRRSLEKPKEDSPPTLAIQKLDALSQEQMINQFVSTAVPKNKRVLCLIVRDKLSRLHQAKSYFYPIYYLFIQAIVDIDDNGYTGASYTSAGCFGCPDNLAAHNLSQQQAGDQQCSSNETDAASQCINLHSNNMADPTDNSFSASSSISADMMFIGAATSTNNHENNANIKMSGTSYSDNELDGDDNISGEHQINESSLTVHDRTMMLRNHIGIESARSIKPTTDVHNNRPLDESLVYPDNRPTVSTSNKPARALSRSDESSNQQHVSTKSVDSIETRLKIASSMIKSKFDLKDKNPLSKRDEDDDFDDDDEDDDDDDDRIIDTHHQLSDALDFSQDIDRVKGLSEPNNDDNNNRCDDHNKGINSAANKNNTAVPRLSKTKTDTRTSANIVAGLFENDQNPYIGTYGVVLSGKRRKKAKTYLIGLGEDGFMRKNSFCKLKSNVLGTQFCATRVLGNVTADRCTIALINYETNVLGFKGPRKMTVFLAKDPNKPFKNLELYKKDPNAVAQLKNMVPSWNAESQSYVLNFHGRVTQASVKNFQLIECRDHIPNNLDLRSQQTQSPDDRFYTSTRDIDPSTRAQTEAKNDLKNKGSLQKLSNNEQALVEPELEWGYLNNEYMTTEGGSPYPNSSSCSRSGNNEKIIQSHKNLAYNSSIVMQFGRISSHEFTCDVMYPLSILQAFSIALSSFDSKLACE